jgi:hypothetical protein
MAKDRPAIKPASRAEFKAAMEAFAKEVGADLEMVGREQGRLAMRDAMTFSPPMPKGGGRGLSAGAHKAGMNKLGNDVRRIFIPADEPRRGMPVMLRQVINSVRAGDQEGFREIYDKVTPARIRGLSPIMRKIMQDTSFTRAFTKAQNYLNKANIFGQVRPVAGFTTDLRDIHDKYKGRVGGRWPKNAPIGGPQYMVDSMATLEAYITMRQAKVGFVKAGYADALAKIPMPTNKAGVPRNYGSYNAPWVDANRSGFGTWKYIKTKDSFSAVVGNNIGNINSVADQSDVKNLVYGNRVANLNSTVQARLESAIKRANRRRK